MILTNPVRTSQEIHHVCATKPDRLVMFRKAVSVYCESHTEHTNTLRGQNAECLLYSAIWSVSESMAWNGKAVNI